MAYDLNKLTRLKHLEALAQRTKAEFTKTDAKIAELSEKVENLEANPGGDVNVIESISINGVVATPVDKTVEITVPTKVSELTNDSKFQTESDVTTAVEEAIAGVSHAAFKKVDVLPSPNEAEDGVLYLFMNSITGYYDIYAKVGEEIVLLDDVNVDLEGYVQKEEGKDLSSNDFTDEDKAKLDGIPETATDAEIKEMLDSVFGAVEGEEV